VVYPTFFHIPMPYARDSGFMRWYKICPSGRNVAKWRGRKSYVPTVC